jgi:rare lipoprotein A (peptidoglycan hydrolase)
MHKALTKTVTLALLALTACGAAGPATAFAGVETATGGAASAPQPVPRHLGHRGALATWFGPGFYGRRTACGQVLTPEVMGVAHRTLPCGTLVAVAYHGAHLIVPVIDRGPYAGNGAEWDLTLQAARALGITATARIATHVVGRTRNTPTLGQPPVVPIQASTGGISAG